MPVKSLPLGLENELFRLARVDWTEVLMLVIWQLKSPRNFENFRQYRRLSITVILSLMLLRNI